MAGNRRISSIRGQLVFPRKPFLIPTFKYFKTRFIFSTSPMGLNRYKQRCFIICHALIRVGAVAFICIVHGCFFSTFFAQPISVFQT